MIMNKIGYFVKCCNDILVIEKPGMVRCKCGASSVDPTCGGAFMRFLGERSNFQRLNDVQLEIELNREFFDAESARLKEVDGNIVAYNMITGSDFWTELSEKSGIPRQKVKALYHGYTYSPRRG